MKAVMLLGLRFFVSSASSVPGDEISSKHHYLSALFISSLLDTQDSLMVQVSRELGMT